MNAIIQRRKYTRHVLIQLTQTDTYTDMHTHVHILSPLQDGSSKLK